MRNCSPPKGPISSKDAASRQFVAAGAAAAALGQYSLLNPLRNSAPAPVAIFDGGLWAGLALVRAWRLAGLALPSACVCLCA